MTLNRLIGVTALVCLILAVVIGGSLSAPLLVATMVLVLVVLWRTRATDIGSGNSPGVYPYGPADTHSSGHHHAHHGGFGAHMGGHGGGGHGGGGHGGH